MASKLTKKGFTLVELLIATAIFAVFLTSIVTLLVDIYRSSRRITLEDQIYQDLRIMVKQVSDLLENSTIDYEEYYRKAVGGDLYTKSSDPTTYTYGDYGKLFYDFGSGGTGLSGEGALCNDGITPANSACVVDKTTIDRNMGKNPPLATFGDPESATAFCGASQPPYAALCTPAPTVFNLQSELYLINANGDRKTILGLELITKTVDGDSYDEKVLSTVWFNGIDTDSDDVPDDWIIGDEFNNTDDADLMTDLATPKPENEMYKDFSPISPVRTNILDLKFYISPLEDPYKAFAETDPATGTLVQPHITLVMTVEPSASELTNYLGEIPRQTIQTTIYSKVKQEVRSY